MLAVGSGKIHAIRQRACFVCSCVNVMVVEHCLVHRNRKSLMRTERDRVAELLRVFEAVDVQYADAHPIRADPEPDVLAR